MDARQKGQTAELDSYWERNPLWNLQVGPTDCLTATQLVMMVFDQVEGTSSIPQQISVQ